MEESVGLGFSMDSWRISLTFLFFFVGSLNGFQPESYKNEVSLSDYSLKRLDFEFCS